jgi:hypothetical protein
MTDTTKLIDDYIACWNETDAGKRRALIDRAWTERATYVDPMMSGDGRTGIDAMIAGVQAKFPGFRFRVSKPVEAVSDRVRFSWECGPDGTSVIGGTDFATVADGRLSTVTGFIDFAPGMTK